MRTLIVAFAALFAIAATVNAGVSIVDPNTGIVCVDFEDLTHGDRIDSGLDPYDGLTIMGEENGSGDFREVRIFDTDPNVGPINGDDDLKTDPSIGLLAIVQNNNGGTPNDEASGGILTFTFDFVLSQLSSVDLLDIESTETYTIETWLAGGLVATTGDVAGSGDNVRIDVPLGADFTNPFDTVVVKFSGSGSINGFKGVVPEPSTILAGIALTFIAGTVVARRFRQGKK